MGIIRSTLLFTEDELERLASIIKTTWDYVANDLSMEGPFGRDAVFEVAVDADRLHDFCEPTDAALVDRFYELSWEEMMALKERLLPFREYE